LTSAPSGFGALIDDNAGDRVLKQTVLITSRIPADLVNILEQRAAVIQGPDQYRSMAREDVIARLGDVDAIVNQNELKIDSPLLNKAPRLKIVANATAGFDNMDVPAMRERRVWGTNAPDSYSVDTANHTIALLLGVTRRLIEADQYVRSGRWKNDGWTPGGRWDGISLSGRRMGLIGHGHIGRHVARRAEAFGMTVHHHTRSGAKSAGWLPLDELLRCSDVISLHCPLNESTRHLIGAEALRAMKPGAVLLNVSRGAVVDITALVAALEQKRLAGAGLDVFEFEPDVPAELMAMPNVVLSPHMGGCTTEARQSAFHVCVNNVIRVLSGEPPDTPVFAL
jgi:glyoxylate reductase